MKLVVGLGNPGEKYKNTRHNAGWIVLDKLKQKISNSEFLNSNKFDAEILKINNLVLAKPTTYMNDSGKSVVAISTFYKLSVSDIFVIHDDLDIKLGLYKIQQGVGPRVHNGIKSIEDKLGKNFWRVRIGTENRVINLGLKARGEEYVLQNFEKEEVRILEKVTNEVVNELIENFQINKEL